MNIFLETVQITEAVKEIEINVIVTFDASSFPRTQYPSAKMAV